MPNPQELVTQAAVDFVESRLSQKELALLRVMARNNAIAEAKENRVTVGDDVYEDGELVVALQGKLIKYGYVARNEDGGAYFLTPKGTAAAFAPRLGTRTWVEIVMMAAGISVVCAAAAVVGWHIWGPKPVIVGVEPPIGSIVAWHKKLCTSALPDGWVACNGPISPTDPEYDKTAKIDLSLIPDLNGDGRFLRGGTASGSLQQATGIAMQPNRHVVGAGALLVIDEDGRESRSPASLKGIHQPNGDDKAALEYGQTRPINMSVVWIIRVK